MAAATLSLPAARAAQLPRRSCARRMALVVRASALPEQFTGERRPPRRGQQHLFFSAVSELNPCASLSEQLRRAIHNRCWGSASPSVGKQFSLLSTSEDATGRLAALLAAEMRAGDAYCLKGDQGGGKTTFRQAALPCRAGCVGEPYAAACHDRRGAAAAPMLCKRSEPRPLQISVVRIARRMPRSACMAAGCKLLPYLIRVCLSAAKYLPAALGLCAARPPIERP